MSEISSTHGQSIVLENLTKVYPGVEKPAVDNVSMSIPAGDFVVFVGPSGCGKTTTMKMINRLIEPTAGASCWAARTSRTPTRSSCGAASGTSSSRSGSSRT